MATTAGYTEQGVGTGAGYQKQHGMETGAGYSRIVLTVKSARNMKDPAWLGKADPYVEVKLADATICTEAIKNAGESATWQESFAFNNVAPDDVIEFHVYDKNRLRKDAHMGEGSLTLRQLFEQGHLDTRIPLSTKTGMQDAGELWVTLRKDETGASGMTEKAGYEAAPMMETQTGATQTGATHTTTTTTETEGARVCGQEYFTKVEDRPVVKERVTYVKEHHPVEKEFVVETRATGVERESMEGRVSESLGTEERVVSVTEPKSPCE